ncbi:MAG TPA: hypothetical protein VK567_09630 [Bradyrhizobium sp.]|jgi:hypothetical protein|nr:hypothetical protein [Bradyrhizobium sp.]
MAPNALKGIRDVYFDGSCTRAGGTIGGLIDAVKSAQQIIEETVVQFSPSSAGWADWRRQRHSGEFVGRPGVRRDDRLEYLVAPHEPLQQLWLCCSRS